LAAYVLTTGVLPKNKAKLPWQDEEEGPAQEEKKKVYEGHIAYFKVKNAKQVDLGDWLGNTKRGARKKTLHESYVRILEDDLGISISKMK
jgi:hypothetical protein